MNSVVRAGSPTLSDGPFISWPDPLTLRIVVLISPECMARRQRSSRNQREKRPDGTTISSHHVTKDHDFPPVISIQQEVLRRPDFVPASCGRSTAITSDFTGKERPCLKCSSSQANHILPTAYLVEPIRSIQDCQGRKLCHTAGEEPLGGLASF
ncbi:hypothetical protein RRG08_048421 [Elysia crispata]|uniref:Uncharacterized protein n=1 Tax=Elysia crispata TaxID=231223 RepID=A0AAE1B8P2_9GAST|nr:hypothetical protein RRG08_048421 [Elysia crispata]